MPPGHYKTGESDYTGGGKAGKYLILLRSVRPIIYVMSSRAAVLQPDCMCAATVESVWHAPPGWVGWGLFPPPRPLFQRAVAAAAAALDKRCSFRILSLSLCFFLG